MKPFLNLDFVYTFTTSAFFFLGTSCLVFYFRSKGKKTLPWLWLGCFGFAYSLNEFLDMVAFLFVDPRFLLIQRSFVLGVSFLCLLEFARRSSLVLGRIRVRPRIYIPIFLFLGLGFWNQQYEDLNIFIRYMLGFPASIWTACVFWLFSQRKETAESTQVYRVISILFFGYGVASGLVGPQADFWPATFIHQKAFFEWTHMPIQLVRGLLISAIAFMLMHQSTRMSWLVDLPRHRPKPIKFILFSFLVMYVAFLFAGSLLVSTVDRHERSHLKKLILSDAQILAHALGDLDFESFAATRGESVYRTYRNLHSRMLVLAELSPLIKSVYLVSFDNGRPSFAVGSLPQVYPGDVVPSFGARIPQKALKDARHSKKPTTFGPYEDRQGRQVFSLFVPLAHKHDQDVSLLGLDLGGLNWQRQLAKFRFNALLIVLVFLAFLIIGYSLLATYALKNQELEIQKKNLDEALLLLKEARDELARSEETFRGILNNSPNAIFGFDRDLKLIFWNNGAERLYGYSKKEVINERNPVLSKKMTDVFGSTELEFAVGKIFTGQAVHSEMLHNKKQGSVDVILTMFPVKDPQGHILFGMGLSQDVSDQKRTVELLKYERLLSKNIIDSISEELMILDCQTKKILDVNKEFLENYHLSKEEVVGKICRDFTHHETPTCDACGIKDVLDGRTVSTTHKHKNHSTGQEIYCDVTLSPLRDENGKIIGVIHLAKDVTDRKHLEDQLRQHSESLETQVKDRTKALQESESKYRRLFEASQDGIFILDASSGIILDVNPYFLKLLGFACDEIVGKKIWEISPLKDVLSNKIKFEELKNKKYVRYDDLSIETKEGKLIEVEFVSNVYDVNTHTVVQCNIRDITEQRKLEKIKTEFVSMVSHELRTPLSAIKEGVEIVADGTQGKLNKSQHECLGIALSNIKRLNRLIGDILDISKIQSKLLKIDTKACDLYDVVEQVYNLVKIEIEKRGLDFAIDLEKNLPVVIGDKDRLIQVLLNLLNNAVKFTREHSKITLAARRSGDFIELSVTDEGAGIPLDALERLFGRFVQLDSTLVRRVGGTGLGLYISRNLVEAMGGKIWAESTLGHGAIFHFTVPIKQ
ncbi:MAG: PAS domain S-box protein [Candidatus Omnitrophota bacterium]